MEILIQAKEDLGAIRTSVAALDTLKQKAEQVFEKLKVGFVGGIGFNLQNQLGALPGMLRSALQEGVALNAGLEESKRGLAALIAQFDSRAPEGFAGRLKMADAALEELRRKGELAEGTFEQLKAALAASAGGAFAAGIADLSQQVDLLVASSQVLGAMGGDQAELGLQLNQILTGTIGPANKLNQVLGFTNKEVKALAAEGKLFEEVMRRFAPTLRDAEQGVNSLASQQTMLAETIADLKQKLAVPLFEAQKQQIAALVQALKDPAFEQGLRSIVQGFAGMQKMAADAGIWLAKHPGLIDAVAKAMLLLGGAFAALKIAQLVQGFNAMARSLAANTSALATESTQVRKNTADWVANAAARKAAAAMAPGVGGSLGRAGGAAAAATGVTPALKADYDRYRGMGKSPPEPMAAARELERLRTAAGGAAKEVGGFGAGLGKALGGLRGALNTPMGGTLAAAGAAYAVNQLASSGIPNLAGGVQLGGKTSENDLSQAEAMRGNFAAEQAEFARRIGGMQTTEDREGLVRELIAAAAAARKGQKKAGFFEEGRTARNTALADHAEGLSRLLNLVNQTGEGLLSPQEAARRAEEEAKRTAGEANAKTNRETFDEFDRARHDRTRTQRVGDLIDAAEERADPARLERAIEQYKAELAALREGLDETMDPEAYRRQLDQVGEFMGHVETLQDALGKVRERAAKENERKEQQAKRDAEDGLRKELELERARSETRLKSLAQQQISETSMAEERKAALERELAIVQKIAELRGEGSHQAALAAEAMAQADLEVEQARKRDSSSKSRLEERFAAEDKFQGLDNRRQLQVSRDMLQQHGLSPRNADGSQFTPAQHLSGATPQPFGQPGQPAGAAPAAAVAAVGELGDKAKDGMDLVAEALEDSAEQVNDGAQKMSSAADVFGKAAGRLVGSIAKLEGRVEALERAAG